MNKAILATKGGGEKVCAAVDQLVDALNAAEAAEQEAGALAAQLGMTPAGARGLRTTRGILHSLLAAKVGIYGKIETPAVHPKEAEGLAAVLAAGASYKPERVAGLQPPGR